MVDIGKQIDFWREGAKEDWSIAIRLIDEGQTRHGLFFLNLAIEKALKSHVCRQTRDIAPKIHNLMRLAEIAALELSQEQMDILADLNEFQIEGRYPEFLKPPLTKEAALAISVRAEEVFQWLTNPS